MVDYKVISADGHIDLIWLPPDLFTGNASAALKERMPYVTDGENGPTWVSRNGAVFGLQNGMGSAGRLYVPGEIYRSDRMAEKGLYEDGKKGIRRLSDPDLRVKDQDIDGVQGEALYGILGACARLEDIEAATEMTRIYNDWLGDFCAVHPNRLAGIACIQSENMAAAAAEIRRVADIGKVRGLELALSADSKPLYHETWYPVWEAAAESKLPVHFHTTGGAKPDYDSMGEVERRQAFAVFITGFQMAMSNKLMEVIYGGVLEMYPDLTVVIGESGIGWIPYILEHMDLEWEDQFKDLNLTMRPSEYWHRQCYATYQSDAVGLRLIDVLGEGNIMWGNDFPHPDGVWPDSQEFIAREMKGVPEAVQRKVLCDNAKALYGFEG